jgi:hypothetical protein
VKRQWLVIVTVGVLGAAGGAYLGQQEAPDAPGVAVSLGVAGFALGGLLGVLVSGWWRPPRKPSAPAEAPSTTTEFTAHERVETPEAPPEPEHAAALVDHPPPPPPPAGGEPGWYKDQAGVRRYWDGERWTEIVWRERPGGRAGKR